MLHQYVPQLKTYDAIAIDAGDQDTGIAATVRALDQVLTDYDIAHTAEIYPGNHVNRIDARLTDKVLPFFAEHLQF